MNDPRPYRAFSENAPQIEFPPQINRLEFTGWMDEQLSWKTTCYIGDWTFVPQIRIKGPDALQLFKDLSVNSFENFPLNRAKHCVQVNEDGKVISEGILFRHGEDEFEYECGTPQWIRYNIATRGYDVETSFPMTHKLQVSGPTSLALLEKLTRTGLRDVKFMAHKPVPVADYDTTFLRQGMAGEIGFEIHGPIQQHDEIWNAVYEAGKEFGIRRLGRRNLMINHMEASYPTGCIHFFNALADDSKAEFRKWVDENPLPDGWRGTAMEAWPYSISTSFTGSWDGDDIREIYRSPVEMGWAANIKFDHDFIGRAALEEEVANPRRKVVTLEFNSDDLVAMYATLFGQGDVIRPFEIPHSPYATVWVDKILNTDGETVGHATFPGYSLHFRKALALSFIDVQYAETGTQVTVLWGNPGEPQTKLRATVASAPYKKDDRRRDLSAEPALSV
jgi:glycine cleavage system aminomethyltransferase T